MQCAKALPLDAAWFPTSAAAVPPWKYVLTARPDCIAVGWRGDARRLPVLAKAIFDAEVFYERDGALCRPAQGAVAARGRGGVSKTPLPLRQVCIEQVDDAPDSLGARALEKEGEALLKRIRPGDHVVALCVEAEAPDSPGLAKCLRRWGALGTRTVLAIGGSNGLSNAVLARADEKLSFSRLTFPTG